MTPRDYVEACQRERPFPADLVDDDAIVEVRERLRSIGVDADTVDVAQDIIVNSETSLHLFESLLPQLPPLFADWLTAGKIAIGDVEDDAPNAHTVPVGDGYAVIVNTGLSRFLYRVARVLATQFDMGEGASIPFADATRLIAENFWWLEGTGRALGAVYEISALQVALASKLTDEALAFLILHETGHAMIRLGFDPEAYGVQVPPVGPAWREEHFADVIAASCTINRFDPSTQPWGLVLAYAGAEFALQVYRALDELSIAVENTHPHAKDRLAVLRAHTQRYCASDAVWASLSSIAVMIETLITRIIETVRDPHEHAAFFDQQAQDVIGELDHALDVCVGGRVPDYARFHSLASDILMRGYPHAVFDRMQAVAHDYVAMLKVGWPREDQDAGRKFQKFKLLMSFIDQGMREPARSVFRQAIRL